jgi:hypothetical protein
VIDNMLYYTLSTIAQTLAAAFGVLTAMVLVRLSTIQSALGTAKAAVRQTWGGNYERVWKALREGGLAGLEKAEFNPLAQDALMQGRLQAGYEAWLEWGRLVLAIKDALIPTGVDIAVCFLALPAVPWLVSHPVYAWTTVVVAVAGAILCLVRYGRLITWLVDRPAE